MKYLHGRRVYVDSVGLRPQPIDPFAVAALDEIGIDLSRHRPKSFDDLEDDYFDLVISLSPEAQHRAVELTRTSSCEIEFWPTMDPSLTTGSREQQPRRLSRAARRSAAPAAAAASRPAGAPIMA